jgi:hypothetical protein
MSRARRFPRQAPAVRPWLCLLLALLVGAPASAGAAEPSGLEEPATDLVFPLETSHPDVDDPLALTGVGVRKKLFFKVYALGMYADAAALGEALAPWAGRSAEELRSDDGLYRALLEASADRLVVMRFVRDVGASSMRDALEDALERGAIPANDPDRQAFLDLWDRTIADGEQVSLLFAADGRLVVRRDGKLVGEVVSARVSRAVLASWLGPDPVSDAIREGVVQRIPELLD